MLVCLCLIQSVKQWMVINLLILHIWLGSGGSTKLVAICGKCAVVSHRTWQTSPQNLEKFVVENCLVPVTSSFVLGVLCAETGIVDSGR